MPRKLVVRKETLAELGDRDLAAVAGGTATVLRTSRCPLATLFTGIYPSINVDCTTVLDRLGVEDTCAC